MESSESHHLKKEKAISRQEDTITSRRGIKVKKAEIALTVTIEIIKKT